MREETVWRHYPRAEAEEVRGNLWASSRAVGVRDERRVARPAVIVSVFAEPKDVAVRGGEDRTFVIRLRHHDEQAAVVDFFDLIGQRVAGQRAALDPLAPVRARLVEQLLRVLRDYFVERACGVEVFGDGEPVPERVLTARGHAAMQREAEINRTLAMALPDSQPSSASIHLVLRHCCVAH